MSFLSQNNAEFLSARITQKGRKSIAEGNFQIKFFQIGDSEFDYTQPFDSLDGIQNNPQQNVLSPFDKDSQIKYPYLIDSLGTTTYGVPKMDSITTTVRNGMGPAGFITEYKPYDQTECTGTTIECASVRLPLNGFTGTNIITFTETQAYLDCNSGSQTSIDTNNLSRFNGCEFVTVVFNNEFISEEQVVSENSTSLIYKIVSISTVTGTTTTPQCDNVVTGQTTITFDRPTPNFSNHTGYAEVICNKCSIEHPLEPQTSTECVSSQVDPSEQHDPWKLNVVWKEKPVGADTNGVDESLSGFTSNKHISTSEYLGYGTSSGQVTNTGTTYFNSYSEEITVSPEEQRCVAIIHYSELGHIYDDPDRFFKYDDYIGSSTESGKGVLVDEEIVTDKDFFNVYIPFIYYENSTGTTIGAEFKMDATDYHLDSTVAGTPGDIRTKYIKYRYLLDEVGKKVGKVFVDKKLIVFDDQELVALLEYRSNRRYTLPAPKVYPIPSENSKDNACFAGTTGQTYWVTYILEYSLDKQLNGLPCNYLTKVEVNTDVEGCDITYPSDIAVKFGGSQDHFNGVGSFQHMKTDLLDSTKGYIVDKFKILVQETTSNSDLLPDPNQWIEMDFTNKIPNHNVGDLIDPSNLREHNFTILLSDIDTGTLFDLENYLLTGLNSTNYIPDEPSNDPQFGDEQPFPGSIKVIRSSDIEELRFLVNLPSDQFTNTQNPTFSQLRGSVPKRVTEVALLDQNKNVLVNAKTSSPIKRIGTQVFSVKLDF